MVKNLDQGRWDESSRDGDRVTFQVMTPKRRFIDRANAPVRDEEGRAIGLLLVFVDVTEERELTQAREDLSNMIVHDLRGPLTAVTTSLKLLNEFVSPEEGKAFAKQFTEKLGIPSVFYETSAKNGENIQETFSDITRIMIAEEEKRKGKKKKK